MELSVILPFEFKHYPYNLCAQQISTTQNFRPRTFPIYDTLACIHSCSVTHLKFRMSYPPYIFTVTASQQILTYSEILTHKNLTFTWMLNYLLEDLTFFVKSFRKLDVCLPLPLEWTKKSNPDIHFLTRTVAHYSRQDKWLPVKSSAFTLPLPITATTNKSYKQLND